MNRPPHTLKAAWVTAITTQHSSHPLASRTQQSPLAFPVLGKMGLEMTRWRTDGISEPCWHINPCFPRQCGRAPQSQKKPGVLSVEDSRTLLDFPLSCIGPFFWGEMVPSAWVRGHRGGAWVTGVDRRSCVSVSLLGGQGRGPCLGRVWVPLAVGA